MEYLKIDGDGPLPSTDEDSVFVGKNNAKAVAEDATVRPAVPVAVPAPGGGGSYPIPAENYREPATEEN
jgi:hypothetical protein